MNESGRSVNQDAGGALQDALKLILNPAVTQKTFSQRKTWYAIMPFKCVFDTLQEKSLYLAKGLGHFTLLILIICFIFYPLSLVHIIILQKINYFQGVLVPPLPPWSSAFAKCAGLGTESVWIFGEKWGYPTFLRGSLLSQTLPCM